MCDLNFLNLSEKTKKNLIDQKLDTIEKISTHYLENAQIKDINNVHDEIFKRHLSELGAIEEPATILKERSNNKSKSWEFSFKTVHSLSEPENYSSENTSTYVSSSKETDFSFIGDSVDGSLNESLNSSVDVSAESGESSGFHMLHTKIRECLLFGADKERILYKDKNSNNIGEKKKDTEDNYLLAYSNFMKENVAHGRIFRMESNSLNDLLSDGIESAKIYYFYGINLSISRVLLLNMLLDIVCSNTMEHKNVKGNVIYIYFGYRSDVKTIRDVVVRKVKNGLKERRKTKKKGKRENTEYQLNDLLSRIYILPIQEENIFFSFLSNIRNNYLKEKQRTKYEGKKEKKNEKEEKKKKKKKKEEGCNDIQNILAIGILNFSELVLNLNLTNSCSYFYLVRELKIISHLMRSPILIFDELKSESTAQFFKSKKGELEHSGMENENEEDRLNNQLVINEMKKNILNVMSQYDEEQMLMEQQWEFGEMDAFVEQEKDRIWGSVNNYIRTDEYCFSKNEVHMENNGENTKVESNDSINDSDSGNESDSDSDSESESENGSENKSENKSENGSECTSENVSDSESISYSKSSNYGESISDSESINESESINSSESINEESDDSKRCGDNNDFMSCSSIESSGKGAQLLCTQNMVRQKSQHLVHEETMKSTFANIEKKNVKHTYVPYGLCNTFDVILEVDVVKKGKSMNWNKQNKKQKIIRFTLLKCQHDSKHLYCHTLLKNDVLCDL